MVRIQGSMVVARPIEEVFDFVADERNEATYNPQMSHVEKLTPGPVGVGTRWHTTIESRRRHLDLAMQVTAYDRPSLLGSTTTMPGAVVHGTVSFSPEGSGTRLAWDWDLRPTGAVRLLGPVVAPVVGWVGRRQEARLWASLKSHLEGQR